MPKLKTHSGAKKRFRVTATGKVVYKKSGRSHLLSGKPQTRIRRLRKKGCLNLTMAKRVKSLLPYA